MVRPAAGSAKLYVALVVTFALLVACHHVSTPTAHVANRRGACDAHTADQCLGDGDCGTGTDCAHAAEVGHWVCVNPKGACVGG